MSWQWRHQAFIHPASQLFIHPYTHVEQCLYVRHGHGVSGGKSRWRCERGDEVRGGLTPTPQHHLLIWLGLERGNPRWGSPFVDFSPQPGAQVCPYSLPFLSLPCALAASAWSLNRAQPEPFIAQSSHEFLPFRISLHVYIYIYIFSTTPSSLSR